jgi:hypothetical protein
LVRLPLLLTTSEAELISAIDYLVLAAAAGLLCKHVRTFAPILIALGFALALLYEIALLAENWRFVATLRGESSDTFFIIHHHPVLRYFALLGQCFAAIGLWWHALTIAKREKLA